MNKSVLQRWVIINTHCTNVLSFQYGWCMNKSVLQRWVIINTHCTNVLSFQYGWCMNKSVLQHWVIIKTHCTKCLIISVWMVYEQVCIAALGYHKYSLYKMSYHFSMDGVWTSLHCSVGLSEIRFVWGLYNNRQISIEEGVQTHSTCLTVDFIEASKFSFEPWFFFFAALHSNFGFWMDDFSLPVRKSIFRINLCII